MASKTPNETGVLPSTSQPTAAPAAATAANTREQGEKKKASSPTSPPNPPQSFDIPAPSGPVHRRRSRAVTEQDLRVVSAIRSGIEVKHLGAKGTDYVNIVEHLRNKPQGSAPPKGYRAIEQSQPGTEAELIAKAKKLLSGPPPWARDRKYEYPNREQLD